MVDVGVADQVEDLVVVAMVVVVVVVAAVVVVVLLHGALSTES